MPEVYYRLAHHLEKLIMGYPFSEAPQSFTALHHQIKQEKRKV